MSKKPNHTKLPWVCHSGCVWQDGPDVYPKGNQEGTPIAKMDRTVGNGTIPAERDENARFIVQACNSYYPLLEACKAVRDDWEHNLTRAMEMVNYAIAIAERRY